MAGLHLPTRARPARSIIDPDAYLIGLCRDLAEAQHAYLQPQAPNQTECEYDRAVAERRERVDEIAVEVTRLPVRANAGFRAVAEVLRAYPARTLIQGIEDETQGWLILSLISELSRVPYPEMTKWRASPPPVTLRKGLTHVFDYHARDQKP